MKGGEIDMRKIVAINRFLDEIGDSYDENGCIDVYDLTSALNKLMLEEVTFEDFSEDQKDELSTIPPFSLYDDVGQGFSVTRLFLYSLHNYEAETAEIVLDIDDEIDLIKWQKSQINSSMNAKLLELSWDIDYVTATRKWSYWKKGKMQEIDLLEQEVKKLEDERKRELETFYEIVEEHMDRIAMGTECKFSPRGWITLRR